MTNDQVILDASAVLAVLNEEPGYKRVEESLTHSIISSVNFSEVLTVLTDIGISPEEAEDMTAALLPEIIPYDQKQAFISASLRKLTKPFGLSLGDRACLSLAKLHGSIVLTADKIWSKLHIPGVKIQLIR